MPVFMPPYNITEKCQKRLRIALFFLHTQEFAILNVHTAKQADRRMVAVSRNLFLFSFGTPRGAQSLIIADMAFIFI
ncbi:hypothetical protein AWH49_17600 [Domibacillus aminovorans]|uniref:Uncharacterized protein n=1 Tax=Domibacillus aminovorans TaxID=29332 RepID=A0A177L409_9BACI|nr:hypothetical protein AWH49_17600 [Domibacillus aminovorans]